MLVPLRMNELVEKKNGVLIPISARLILETIMPFTRVWKEHRYSERFLDSSTMRMYESSLYVSWVPSAASVGISDGSWTEMEASPFPDGEKVLT